MRELLHWDGLWKQNRYEEFVSRDLIVKILPDVVLLLPIEATMVGLLLAGQVRGR
ncbi:hypothetical protein M431DRAFT_513615 [Trichoderma harzianum CBS 226.95]|uniref:Uncharacterized protein n=1 Tax=Trichoderma harzianum CBS 226.95 TaxID=983964 RepID=A0A2T3ZUY8_TRIHA|nr:hypothetical protein M431DRAFT_513615 [Trichoderma harzianum CBS 226.95]PTB48616.1 hypothetical protein M431DRAFT_513615 [Trichoderma harzianum CBS 226.95]